MPGRGKKQITSNSEGGRDGGREERKTYPSITASVTLPTQPTLGLIWTINTHNFHILTHMMERDA